MGSSYDLILAANGYHPLSAYKRALAPQGIYVMAGGTSAQIFQAMLLGSLYSQKGGKKMGGVSAKTSQSDLVILKELLEAGKIVPVIDRRYPFSETAEALRYLGSQSRPRQSGDHGGGLKYGRGEDYPFRILGGSHVNLPVRRCAENIQR